MEGTNSDILGELPMLLKGISQTCDRIGLLASSFASQGKTGALVHKHITERLLPSSKQYSEHLESLLSSGDEGTLDTDKLDASAYRSRFQQAHNSLVQAQELIPLVGAAHDIDDADEFNALYGEFVVKRPEASYFRECDVHRLHASFRDVMNALSQWFGPNSTTPNHQWGLPGYPVPDLRDQIENAIGDFADSLEDFPRPRHVHKYQGGPPYEWDFQADPASGSHCIVRKAVSTLTNKVVAVKTISMASTQKHRNRILRELGVLELCDHPNLIRLMDAYETGDGKIHLVTAPWAPFTLLDFLTKSDRGLGQRCPWFKPASTSSQRIIVRLFHDLAAGVEELHRMSIKHKDLKPDNILLYREESGEEVRAIITDCGVSKFYKDGGYTNFIQSTYTYLAPEQLDKISSSLKSDIWQLGCCFSLALTQVCGGSVAVDRLWDSFTNTEDNRACTIAQERAHFLQTLRDVCSVNGQLLKLIMGMLKEDPTHRWDIKMVRAKIRDLK